MNIQISRKNKNIIENSRSNPLMAGFPLFAIEKFIQILMNRLYGSLSDKLLNHQNQQGK